MKTKFYFSKIIRTVILTFCLTTFLYNSTLATTVTKNYSVEEFSKIKIESAFQVEYIISDENKVIITIDADEADRVFVGNKGDELIIKMKDFTGGNSITMKAKVYGKSLSGISISGASGFICASVFSGNNISLKCSGASNLEIECKTKNLEADVSGASKVILHGNASEQDIDISGASDYNAQDCLSTNIDIEASGASKAFIYCSETLKADASGASDIVYYTRPKQLFENTSGASKIKQN